MCISQQAEEVGIILVPVLTEAQRYSNWTEAHGWSEAEAVMERSLMLFSLVTCLLWLKGPSVALPP